MSGFLPSFDSSDQRLPLFIFGSSRLTSVYRSVLRFNSNYRASRFEIKKTAGQTFELETTGRQLEAEPQEHFGRSREYWIGYALCYYQWFSGRSYSDIFQVLTYEDLEAMYHTLHEADVTKFADIVNERMRAHFKDTNLKRIRTSYGCTQAELAKRSGVSLRSIQMYEQRNKNINKASVDALYRISKVLGCSIESLIER